VRVEPGKKNVSAGRDEKGGGEKGGGPVHRRGKFPPIRKGNQETPPKGEGADRDHNRARSKETRTGRAMVAQASLPMGVPTKFRGQITNHPGGIWGNGPGLSEKG